jgi:hypothetical protein
MGSQRTVIWQPIIISNVNSDFCNTFSSAEYSHGCSQVAAPPLGPLLPFATMCHDIDYACLFTNSQACGRPIVMHWAILTSFLNHCCDCSTRTTRLPHCWAAVTICNVVTGWLDCSKWCVTHNVFYWI